MAGWQGNTTMRHFNDFDFKSMIHMPNHMPHHIDMRHLMILIPNQSFTYLDVVI